MTSLVDRDSAVGAPCSHGRPVPSRRAIIIAKNSALSRSQSSTSTFLNGIDWTNSDLSSIEDTNDVTEGEDADTCTDVENDDTDEDPSFFEFPFPMLDSDVACPSSAWHSLYHIIFGDALAPAWSKYTQEPMCVQSCNDIIEQYRRL